MSAPDFMFLSGMRAGSDRAIVRIIAHGGGIGHGAGAEE
jgi:hypothetical protein